MKRILALILAAACATLRLAPAAPPEPPAAPEAPGVGPFNTIWPGFGKTRDARRQGFARTKAADAGAIVFLGDSITEGFDLKKFFPGLKTANRGISGDTSRGMLVRLPADVLGLKPRAVVLLCGINDLNQQPPGTPEQVAANVKSILTAIRAANRDTPIFVPEIFPSANRPLDAITATNRAVDAVVAGFPGVVRVRVFAALADARGLPDRSLYRDPTHLNDAGYARYAPLLHAALAQSGVR